MLPKHLTRYPQANMQTDWYQMKWSYLFYSPLVKPECKQPSPTAVWQKKGLVNQWKQAACTSLVSWLGGTMTLSVNHLLPLTNEESSFCKLMSVIGLSPVKESDLQFAFGSELMVYSWQTSIKWRVKPKEVRIWWTEFFVERDSGVNWCVC